MVDIQFEFQDDYLMVINKPAGVVVESAETVKSETLADILKEDYGIKLERGGIVHRLDKDTSGILLVAKTQEGFEALQKQFKERKVKKEYLALVHGWVEEGGRVEGSIGRNPVKREKFMVLQDGSPRYAPSASHRAGVAGKEATTEYEPMGRLQFTGDRLQEIFSDFNKIQMRKLERINYGRFTLLKCHPLTGRTHQIRVHLKYIGSPIVSDEKYVGRKMVRLDKRWCPRMFLHAKKIGFRHPVTGIWIEVESEMPKDLKEALRALEE